MIRRQRLSGANKLDGRKAEKKYRQTIIKMRRKRREKEAGTAEEEKSFIENKRRLFWRRNFKSLQKPSTIFDIVNCRSQ